MHKQKSLKVPVPRTRHLVRRLPNRKIFLYLSLVLAFLAVFWWVMGVYYLPRRQTTRSDYYESLDLSQAQQATYTNSPIEVVKDFGVSNGVHKELISFAVPKDGLSEYGLMTLPAKAASKYPVIVLCHGYAQPQTYSTLESYIGDMNFYSQHGFAVVKPDLRGNGFSLANGTADSAFYSMGYNTDVLSLIAAIKATSYLNQNDINLWGHSMGGYVALRAAVLSSDIKNLILLSAPVGTPQDMYVDYTPISDTNNQLANEIREDELQANGTPLSNPSYWDKASPLYYLKGMKTYVQINVGTADKIVPPKFSADLNAALTKAGVPHQYFVYQNGHHGLGHYRAQIWARSLKLLKSNP